MNLLAANNNDPKAFYIVLGLGAFLIVYVVIRPFMRRKKDPMSKPSFGRSLSQQRSVERQMETLLVELSEMSRQMTSQLDTRAAKLELLIKDADERIGLLQQMQQAPMVAPAAIFETVPVTAPLAPEPPEPPHELDPRHEEIYTLADTGKSVTEIALALSRPSGEIELILALRPR